VPSDQCALSDGLFACPRSVNLGTRSFRQRCYERDSSRQVPTVSHSNLIEDNEYQFCDFLRPSGQQ
jgi:hypothetical protein